MMAEHSLALKMEHIDKSFMGVKALQDVKLEVRKGEVHALLGENGAGKSTLIKILGGIISGDGGTIEINGEPVTIQSVQDARKYGVSVIHQEISLTSTLSIAQNIFMGQEICKGAILNNREMNRQAQAALDDMGLALNAATTVGSLSIARQQSVEIVKALFFKSQIIVMDEPTASLTDAEVQQLFKRIRQLKESGVSIIYISHRLEELFEISDRVTVMRDGRYIDTVDTVQTDKAKLIALMVGRDLAGNMYPEDRPVGGETVMKVTGLTNERVRDVSFELKKGEILGFSGLVGAGRTEMARSVFGLDAMTSGEIVIEGDAVSIRTPQDAIRNGIVLVPENRKSQGLILLNSIGFNLTLPVLGKFIHGIYVNRKKEKGIIEKYAKSLSIKMANTDQYAAELSGGNQQKVVISKWLAAEPKIIILDEPTRGIDVGAKAEIYHLINRLAKEGMSIIMISSELPEVINVSSRIAVMSEGRITKIIDQKDGLTTQETIMHYATIGGTDDE